MQPSKPNKPKTKTNSGSLTVTASNPNPTADGKKTNRTTRQKPKANKPPEMKGTTKTYAGQKTYSGGKPPKPQLPQPAKPIRRRPCCQHAEFRDDA